MSEDLRVREFWRALGLPGIIDVHTHFMPANVMEKVWGYFDAVGPLTGREWPIHYRHEEDVRVEHLRGFGVRRFTSMIYPHKPEMAAWLNQWSAEFAAQTPDCLRTSTFYPEESAAAYVAEAIESGTRVFKSHIQVGDYSPNDALLDPCGVCCRRRVSPWSSTADRGRRPAPTRARARSPNCCRGTRGCT